MFYVEVGILKNGVLKEKEKYEFKDYDNALNEFNELYNNDILKDYDYIRLYFNSDILYKPYKYYKKNELIDFEN